VVSIAQALAQQFAATRQEIAEIERQLHLYRVIADTCPLPVVLLDSHGDNVYVNHAYCDMLECTHQDLLYKGWRNFVDPEMLAPIDTAWGEYVSNPTGKFVASLTFLSGRTKTKIQTHVFASHIPNDGFVAYVIPLDNCAIPCLNGHC